MSQQTADDEQPTGDDQRTRSTDADDRQGACCEPAGHSLPEGAVAEDVQTMATLGNDTRYEALRVIAAAEEDVCVCEIEPALGVSQGAVSQALSRLFGAGLVERRKDGRWRYYSTTPRAERLLAVLDETRPADSSDLTDG